MRRERKARIPKEKREKVARGTEVKIKGNMEITEKGEGKGIH